MSTADKTLQALQAYSLKKEGQNRYRCNSPLRPGSDSHGFTLTIEDDEHGAFYDHVSGDKGSLYELAQLLGIDLPQVDKIQVVSTKRRYSGLADYAAAHGLTAADLEHFKWRETMKAERLALEFSTRGGPRWRYLDGNKPFYTSQQGYERCWYGLNSEVMQRVNNGQPLVICNGEISTIAGQKYGLAAVCVTAGENAIPPELINDLTWAMDKDKHQILVALDCDHKGATAARQIVSQFKAQGFKIRAVDLGLGHAGDLADFCMLHGPDSAAALLNCKTLLHDVQPDHDRGWKIIHASDLKHIPPVKWLIPGEIPEKGMTVIYGPPGIGKSFLTIDYALKVAQEHTVVYVAAEGESGYHARVGAWCKHNARNEGKLYLCLGSPNMMNDSDLESFTATIASIAPAMVVVDTLAMAMIGGDENSARDMGKVIQASRAIQREANCAVVLVHHTNKGGTVERGSGALRGAADSMIRLTGDDDMVLIESAKSKDAAPFPSRYMKLLPVVLGDELESRVLIQAAMVTQQTTDPLTRNQRQILETLALPIFKTTGASVSELEETTDLARGSIQRIISRLMELGFVTQSAKREPYTITEAGLLKVNDSVDSVNAPESASLDQHAPGAMQQPSQASQPSQTPLLTVEEPQPKPRHQYSEGL